MSQRYIGGVVTETTNVAQSPWTGEWTQQAALQGFAGAQAPLKVANSLRFRSSASAYLSRTPSVAGNRTTWTWSGWVKIGLIQAQILFEAQNGTTFSRLQIDGNLNLSCVGGTSGVVTTFNVASSAVIRDPSAWYHFVAVFDTTQATAANRIKLYINGIQVSSFTSSSYPSQNSTWSWNSVCAHDVGRYLDSTYGAGGYFDGYMANIDFIDGQALPPTAFGTINKENGVWSPSAYTGTYGTNGFRLNFSNGTSTTTLGYDSSGNGNNWTTNNISLTAGSTYDWMIDSPTKFPGSSYGVGNYCTLNPLNNPGGSSIVNGNLGITTASTGNGRVVGSMAVSSGKWYWEVTPTNLATNCFIGIALFSEFTAAYPGSTATSYGYTDGTGQKFNNGSGSAYGATYVANDVIGVALDLDAGTLIFYKNNASQGTAFSGISGSYVPALSDGGTGTSVFVVNFGQRPFAYTPPSGYKSLCTQNLPGVTIQNGAQYMAATTYTGTAGTQAISNSVNGVSFQPGFVWIKNRGSGLASHMLQDSVRGNYEYLQSNATATENTNSGYDWFKSFDASGFTVAATSSNGTSTSEWNSAGYTYIGWQWKAGGTAVTNTAGSITSSVSANTTAGFSVVTYTGTGANATVGHGLGVAPSMVIVKNRATAATSWIVYHASLSNTQALYLNTTDAALTSNLFWNNTSPTSSVFSVAAYNPTNQASTNIVAYCFAAIPGYSAFGSYTGNGSTNGPFVYCGFRPRWVMIKLTSGVENWYCQDSSRGTYNANTYELFPNLSNAEQNSTSYSVDFLSNGFKLRTSDTSINASGGTYIYAAFAENPFQNALAR